MADVAVFLAPGFEEIEALTVVDYLRRANVNVITVAVPLNSDDSPMSVTGSHKVTVIADTSLKDFIEKMDGELPDAVYFPGGMPGASNLAANQYLFQLITKMDRRGKLVAAMCAAPAVVLARTGILANRKWTCYPGMEQNLAEYCGSEVGARELTENTRHIENVPFVFDNNVLTGRGPGTAEQFAMKFVELLAGAETAVRIHDGSCQR
ncbi:DJ-1 family glyoxalase III [uncultured Treponema sp.]|uniref:DJ-1 family glyoxalase III n=1 Tax=uncultured Treponema sp. TaxID=162155 RepID=UPI0025DDBC09|nr:DJ-1 family glyoxalase III [uncultured Treponema sp.]